ncbi:hypothetical protein HNE_1619 [Hyphomonas neptunium ATCC 15444]|uniref:Uncharacterized protein n=1 Tax=Hyphomonas neptunium (strain ATCC 15444) TaxID=228405 RepID=Q0C1R6_HYPNA|nr:hypothetical protein HNE_1619 [Hyphomonas neptunium ATCC 15444]
MGIRVQRSVVPPPCAIGARATEAVAEGKWTKFTQYLTWLLKIRAN